MRWPGAESNCRHADFQFFREASPDPGHRTAQHTTRYYRSTSADGKWRRLQIAETRCTVEPTRSARWGDPLRLKRMHNEGDPAMSGSPFVLFSPRRRSVIGCRQPALLAIVGGLLAVVVTSGCKEAITPPELLTVTAVSPASGPLGGGTDLAITGTNFTDVTDVTIGGSELGGRMVVSPTQITGHTLAVDGGFSAGVAEDI